jgi:hypothetical protein
MPAKRQRISVPENRRHLKETTNRKSASRGRVGGVGCFGLPSDPSTILSIDNIATLQQSGIYYLNADTTISSNQTLIIQPGQQLRFNKTPTQINGPGTYFTLTNNGTIILNASNSTTIPSGTITTINQNFSSSPSTVAFTNSGTITCYAQSNLFINGMVNSGTINIGSGAVITIPADASSSCTFLNTSSGIINNNKGVIFFSNTFTNSGTITNNSAIYIGSLGVSGTLINTKSGTINNQNGTITKNVPGSTFTNNGGTYNGPLPV